MFTETNNAVAEEMKRHYYNEKESIGKSNLSTLIQQNEKIREYENNLIDFIYHDGNIEKLKKGISEVLDILYPDRRK